MVLINYATKEIIAKVVYYGPGLCGKTTNLQQVYAKLNPKKRGKMIALATDADRTLFFDFLPVELGVVQGFKVRFQLYTVPGQVYYSSTRKLVLKGADAVVFVSDSQADVLDKNVESIEDMKRNLLENDLDPYTIPMVFQHNKRDLANILGMRELDAKLNYRSAPSYESVAVTGAGVMETFREVTNLLIRDLKKKHTMMNTDALRELSMEVFQQKEEKPRKTDSRAKEPAAARGGRGRPSIKPAAEEISLDSVLELGSGYRDDGGADVAAGSMLDQIEVISLADEVQAEAFFDSYRKGDHMDAAREKAEKAKAVQVHEEDGSHALKESGLNPLLPEEHEFVLDDFEDPSVRPLGPQAAAPEDEYESFADVDLSTAPPAPSRVPEDEYEPFADVEMEEPQEAEVVEEAREVAPAPAPVAAAAPSAAPSAPARADEPEETEVLIGDGALERYLRDGEPPPVHDALPLWEKTGVEPARAPEAEAVREEDFVVQRPFWEEDEPEPAPEPEPEPAPAPAKAAKPAGKKASSAAADAAPAQAPARDYGPEFGAVLRALENLQNEVQYIKRELTETKRSVSELMEREPPPAEPVSAAPAQVDLAEAYGRLDAVEKAIKDAAEEQSRVMLSIIEAVRESKRANHDAYEKVEDGLKYIADKLREQPKDGKTKKWF